MQISEAANSEPHSLAERLRLRIKLEGPITFCDWMNAALYDPQEGYYCRTSARWGRQGDYRTSPERSPLFAATFARYLSGLFDSLGRPSSWTLLEAGAAEGHFAAVLLDRLRARFPEVFAATNYVVDERSPSSNATARSRLAPFGDRVAFASIQQHPNTQPAVIFSNELLDSLPVHRVILAQGKLRELYVTLDQAGEFTWLPLPLSTPALAEYFELLGIQLRTEGQIAEINLAAASWLASAAASLSPGYLITVDYGAEAAELYNSPARQQGTLRAFRRHEFRNPLADPGLNDLTATVDWTAIKMTGERLGLETIDFEPQDRFLLQVGLLEELEAMTEQADGEAEKASLRASAREMILPGGMANSFQVLIQKK